MGVAENSLLILLIILFLGLVIPEFFRRFKLPFVTSLILAGALAGPYGAGLVEQNEVMGFFGLLGITFLMLMAGLEIDVEQMKHSKFKISVLAFANGVLPFVAGFAVATAFGYGVATSLLVATIFVSSSVAVIIPSVKSAGLFSTKEGQLMVSAILVEDVMSLILLAVIFHAVVPITQLPLPMYLLVLILSVFAMKMIIPAVSKFFIVRRRRFRKKDEHEVQLRFVILILVAALVLFSYLGVHPIIAAFFVGVLLSGVITSGVIYDKLHTLGYGLFIPVFFFIVGMQMDFSMFLSWGRASLFTVVLIVFFIMSKVVSGYVSARSVGIDRPHARFFGMVSVPHLTTALAATYAAASAGLICADLVTAIIMLSIVTTIVAPVTLRTFPKFFGVGIKDAVIQYRGKGDTRV